MNNWITCVFLLYDDHAGIYALLWWLIAQASHTTVLSINHFILCSFFVVVVSEVFFLLSRGFRETSLMKYPSSQQLKPDSGRIFTYLFFFLDCLLCCSEKSRHCHQLRCGALRCGRVGFKSISSISRPEFVVWSSDTHGTLFNKVYIYIYGLDFGA